ncbi:hypothetical protein ACFX1X_027446 [Malus domestica]
MREFERNRINLTLTKTEEMQRVRVQIDELSLLYVQNLNEDGSFLLFTEAVLAGLPSEFLKSFGKVADAILELCEAGTRRRMVAVAYGKRGGEFDRSILEVLVQMSHKFARLLGYSSYADYAVDLRKAEAPSKRKEEGDHSFGVEDLPYCVNKAEAQQFNVDLGAQRQYFPVNLVLSGVFKIVQYLFGLGYKEIEDAEVWHSDVCVNSSFGELWVISTLICTQEKENIIIPVWWLFKWCIINDEWITTDSSGVTYTTEILPSCESFP